MGRQRKRKRAIVMGIVIWAWIGFEALAKDPPVIGTDIYFRPFAEIGQKAQEVLDYEREEHGLEPVDPLLPLKEEQALLRDVIDTQVAALQDIAAFEGPLEEWPGFALAKMAEVSAVLDDVADPLVDNVPSRIRDYVLGLWDEFWAPLVPEVDTKSPSPLRWLERFYSYGSPWGGQGNKIGPVSSFFQLFIPDEITLQTSERRVVQERMPAGGGLSDRRYTVLYQQRNQVEIRTDFLTGRTRISALRPMLFMAKKKKMRLEIREVFPTLWHEIVETFMEHLNETIDERGYASFEDSRAALWTSIMTDESEKNLEIQAPILEAPPRSVKSYLQDKHLVGGVAQYAISNEDLEVDRTMIVNTLGRTLKTDPPVVPLPEDKQDEAEDVTLLDDAGRPVVFRKGDLVSFQVYPGATLAFEGVVDDLRLDGRRSGRLTKRMNVTFVFDNQCYTKTFSHLEDNLSRLKEYGVKKIADAPADDNPYTKTFSHLKDKLLEVEKCGVTKTAAASVEVSPPRQAVARTLQRFAVFLREKGDQRLRTLGEKIVEERKRRRQIEEDRRLDGYLRRAAEIRAKQFANDRLAFVDGETYGVGDVVRTRHPLDPSLPMVTGEILSVHYADSRWFGRKKVLTVGRFDRYQPDFDPRVRVLIHVDPDGYLGKNEFITKVPRHILIGETYVTVGDLVEVRVGQEWKKGRVRAMDFQRETVDGETLTRMTVDVQGEVFVKTFTNLRIDRPNWRKDLRSCWVCLARQRRRQ